MRRVSLDRLLTERAIAYVNDPRGASFRNARLRVSSIYDWFRDDFGGSPLDSRTAKPGR